MGCICFNGRREDRDTTAFSKDSSLSWGRKKGDTEGRIAEDSGLIGGEMPCQQRPTYNPQSTITAQGGSIVIAPAINSTVGGDININVLQFQNKGR